ncbi:hypothetical protein [Trujillonella humicola]
MAKKTAAGTSKQDMAKALGAAGAAFGLVTWSRRGRWRPHMACR